MGLQTFDPNGIVAGPLQLVHDKITLLSGAGALVRGTVLGRQTGNAATSAAKAGGNTGNGTFTLDVTTPVLAGAKPGVYTVRCIAAATNSGTFRVEDPDGIVIGDVAVGATFADDIKFVIADGSSDFVVGDGFDVTVTASGKWKKSIAASIDGTEIPRAILAEDVDASAADKDCPAYFMGEFADEKLVYGAGHTKATCNAAFRDRGVQIFIRSIGAVA